ncbi:Phosphoglycerate mutase [Phytophthora palmivora]|uniref:Phosphoglycerate mutase n=1 Tax=Phytophthora palmivora TaxID=4796 RepID=A0A2P4Y0Y5_9STRA|nr:Phosphoglycerate mutase [Phytophthora palmivora]
MAPHRQHSSDFQLQLDLIENKAPTIVQQLPPVSEGCSRLYLCRHGQTDFNRQRKLQGRGVNMALNAEGLDQAKCLAKAMKDVPLTAIYSSGLKRAFQTADTVAQLHPKIEVQQFNEVEEMNFGKLEGHPMEMHEEQIQTMFKRWEHGEFNAAWPGGESPRDVVNRGVKKITEVVSNTPPKEQVLMVTHGRFNKIVLAQMLHGELTHMTEIGQDNTCVNVIDFDHATQTFHAMALNNTNHLPSPPSV